jgi:hypothetical protein
MQALVPVLQANIREHMIMQYEEQMTGMLTQGVEQAGVGSPEAISQITQGAAQEILQNNQRMAEQGSVEDLERMTLELQRQQLELEKEKVKIDAAQKAADIAIQEEKLDLEKDALEINSAEKLAKIKGVERDREIVASTKEADRNDKFLIEVMKMLVKETGATVEKMKEEVVLRPERFNQGGFAEGEVVGNPLEGLMGMIGNFAKTAAMPITSVIEMIFGDPAPKPKFDPGMAEVDVGIETTEEGIGSPTDFIGGTTDFTSIPEIDSDEFGEAQATSDFADYYRSPINYDVDIQEESDEEKFLLDAQRQAIKQQRGFAGKTELPISHPISHPLDPEAQDTMAGDIVSLEDYGDIEGDIPVPKNVMEDRIAYTKRMQDALKGKGKVEPTPPIETTGESDDMEIPSFDMLKPSIPISIQDERGDEASGDDLIFDQVVTNIAYVESGNKHYTPDGKTVKRGKDGEIGLMQVKPGRKSAKIYASKKDLLDPKKNLELGTTYLRYLLGRFGNITDAVLAYNWGESKVKKWIKGGRKPEELNPNAKNYVKKVLGKDI